MKKMLIFILLPLILLIGAGAGAFFMGMIPGFSMTPTKAEMEAEKKAEEAERRKREIPPDAFKPSETEKPSHYTLDEFVVNVKSDRVRPIFLLLSVSLELANEGLRPNLQAVEPRLRDTTNMFLSSRTIDELKGYKGIQFVRQGLWKRYYEILGPEIMLNLQVMKMTIK